MFVLLFGLMGVAAIFPVGNHYVVEGEKFDQGSILAQNAFEELRARGMLRPEYWLYASNPGTATGGTTFMVPPGATGAQVPAPGSFNYPTNAAIDPGRAFVIDPMSAAAFPPNTSWFFQWPMAFQANGTPVQLDNPWDPVPPGSQFGLPGESWPVRRMTLPIPDPNNPGPGSYQHMVTSVAETIFRLRDDLAVELPDRDDVPGIQRWNTFDVNNTPNNPNDDQLLTRQYTGNFSWLATIVPQTGEALLALQPAYPAKKGYLYDVSVVVFYKRDMTPSPTSERLIEAEMQGDGEIVLYSTGANPDAEVDAAFKDIKPGEWISVMGVNQQTGGFMMKWYRLLALDEENNDILLGSNTTVRGRHAMLTGPDWHQPGVTFAPNLRAAILPGVASVVTRAMTLEKDSLWNAE